MAAAAWQTVETRAGLRYNQDPGFGPSDPLLHRLAGLAPPAAQSKVRTREDRGAPDPERPLGLTTRGAVWRKPAATSSATESRPADGWTDMPGGACPPAQVMGERVG